MMDHGFFDGPYRGGMSGGKPWILTDEGRAWLKKRNAERKAKAEGTER